MENTQTPVAAKYDQAGSLVLHSHFKTIQGEGPFCGERALFFRLSDCNLRCPGCDTDYTSERRHVAEGFLHRVATEVQWPEGALIVITGGEPMRQNIAPAINKLLSAGYVVQIETNGVTCAPDLPWDHDRFHVVVSPKTKDINAVVHRLAKAFKYVLQAGAIDHTDGLPTRALGHAATPRVARPRAGALTYVQPMDEQDSVANALNLDAAIRSTIAHGHRLQIQVHKAINMA